MRVTIGTSVLVGAAVITLGFLAAYIFNSDPNLRGNARTLYRPSSFPVADRAAPSRPEVIVKAELPADQTHEAKLLLAGDDPATSPSQVSVAAQQIAVEVKQPPSKLPSPKELVLYHPVVLDGATLSAQKRRVQLQFTHPVPLSTTCPSKNGDKWPCGTRARTALRAFIQQKRVVCVDMEFLQVDEVIASCRVGKHDLATWLIEKGWAKASHNAPQALKQKAELAQRTEQGIWRSKLVQLSEDETATLINSWEELAINSTSTTPLVVEGEPKIIWRPRNERQKDTQQPKPTKF